MEQPGHFAVPRLCTLVQNLMVASKTSSTV